MKRFLGILAVTVYMLSFAELHNLLRIPVLIAHLEEHQQKDPGFTIWAFLEEHYIGPMVVDEDYDRDQQLPFRDAACCVVALHYSCECSSTAFELYEAEPPSIEFQLYRDRSKTLLAAADFFQPPRFA